MLELHSCHVMLFTCTQHRAVIILTEVQSLPVYRHGWCIAFSGGACTAAFMSQGLHQWMPNPCLSPDMPGVAVTEVPALQGDAIGIASVMMPSQCYGATTRAGPGGALLGLLRRSQFSSLVAQVAMASWDHIQ